MSASSLIKAVYRAANAVLAYTDGQEVVPSVDNRGNLRVSVTNSTDRTATGTLTAAQGNTASAAGSAVEINCQGCGTVGIDVRGTFNETILFEASVDGTNFVSIDAVIPTTGVEASSIVNNGAYAAIFTVPCAGFALVRTRCSVYTSGTATVVLEASSAGQDVILANALPVGDNLVGRVKLSDGTNVATVKAASTAAAFTDTAAVTDIRPGGIFPVVATPADGEAIGSLTKIRALMTLVRAGSTTLTDLAKGGVLGTISAASLALGFQNVIPVGQYLGTKPSLLEGQGTTAQLTGRGAWLMALDELPQFQDDTNQVAFIAQRALSTITGAYSTDQSVADEASSVTKASPGRVYGFVFHNGNAAARYVQFYNSTTVPADGAVPAINYLVPITTSINIVLPEAGHYFSTGIAWANSSTRATKTIGAADSYSTVYYL